MEEGGGRGRAEPVAGGLLASEGLLGALATHAALDDPEAGTIFPLVDCASALGLSLHSGKRIKGLGPPTSPPE